MTESLFTESWLAGPQETQFFTRTYRPSSPAKAAVVFVHGFAEHIARYEHVFPTWSSRSIAVFAYDQRGFGRTAQDKQNKSKDSAYAKTSSKEQLEDIEWAVQHTKEQFPGVPVFLYGHSMVRLVSLLPFISERVAIREARWFSHFLPARKGRRPRSVYRVSPESSPRAHSSCKPSPQVKSLGGLAAKRVDLPLPTWLPPRWTSK